MTLANMRESGVRSLSVTCGLGHHEGEWKFGKRVTDA
jgi:hypothetical protein